MFRVKKTKSLRVMTSVVYSLVLYVISLYHFMHLNYTQTNVLLKHLTHPLPMRSVMEVGVAIVL